MAAHVQRAASQITLFDVTAAPAHNSLVIEKGSKIESVVYSDGRTHSSKNKPDGKTGTGGHTLSHKK